MIGKGETILAEARHFRPRDYVLDYVYDRLHGLVLKTGYLAKFGLLVDAESRYSQERDRLVGGDRLKFEKKYKDMVRRELTETFFYSLVQRLESDANEKVDILEGLLTIRRGSIASGIEINHSFWLGTIETPKLVLSKLCAELIKKLEQIQRFLDATAHNATHAVVFFSGIDPFEPEWDALWHLLKENERESQWAWEYVDAIHHVASASIKLPFALIVGKGIPLEYTTFSWKRDNL